MKAMLLDKVGLMKDNPTPLRLAELPDPAPGPGEVLLRVRACGVCHTELDEIEGRTPPPELPVVLGHQVVGEVTALGEGVGRRREKDDEGDDEGDDDDDNAAVAPRLAVGARVGVAWIFSACGSPGCTYCRDGNDNLCPAFRATGRDAHGGYAEAMVVPARFAFAIPERFSDAQAAPLLCAGAIGYRSLRLCELGRRRRLGLTGFGASGHLVLKMARFLHTGVQVYVFARSERERAFALELGAVWAGDTRDTAPEPLDAIIDTTPVWRPVVEALRNLGPGGRLVINAIRKEDHDKHALKELDYAEHLWMEREIKSVANVASRDVSEFLTLAADMGIDPDVEAFALEDANRALQELKQRRIRGAKVLVVAS